ncbi:MAG: hypothetical protein EXS03_01140 [Phycisphaerales bacterium]|nr:hypothetical protein [Phycisphaerales bacterium]
MPSTTIIWLALVALAASSSAPRLAAAGLDAEPSPAFVEWDTSRAGIAAECQGTAWMPIASAKDRALTDEGFQQMVKGIKAQELIDAPLQTITVVGQGGAQGGVAGNGSVIFVLASVPADVVMPVFQAVQAVANYLQATISLATNVTIKVQFQSLAAPTISVVSARVSAQNPSPTLASLIASGSSGATLDDARFMPNPPAPYGTGPAINGKWRVFYSNIQSNGKNRYTSENRLFWTNANLRAAWIYALPNLSYFDGTITFTTDTTTLALYDFDPSDGIPAGGISFQDWLVRMTVVNMGWLSSIQANLAGDSCILDMYRFRSDILAEDTNGTVGSLPTDFGYLTQEPAAFASIFVGLDCDDVSETLETVIDNGGTFSDSNLGLFAPDYNPGGYRPFRTALALNSPFPTTEAQAAFVSSNYGAALSGFSAYGTAIRNQFGGSGIFDDQQLIPLPPIALRTRYLDYTMPSYVSQQGFCYLIDYNPTYPGYYGRFVVRGLNLTPGEVILNFVTGLNGSTTDDSATGVDFEVSLIDDTNGAAGFLDADSVMGQAVIPNGTTYYPTFLSPTELKVIDCLGWDVP